MSKRLTIAECSLTPGSARRATLYNVVANYASSAYTVLTTVVLLPVYLRYFDMATYGAWLASGSLLALSGVVDLGLNLVLAQRLSSAVAHEDKARFVSLSTTGVLLAATSGAVILAIALLAGPIVCHLVNTPESESNGLIKGFFFAGIGTGLMVVWYSLGSVLQALQTPAGCGVSALAGLAAGTATTLIGLSNGFGVAALGLAVSARGAVSLAVLAAWVARDWRRRRLGGPYVSLESVRDLLGATLPVFASRVASAAAANWEPAIVAAYGSPAGAAVLGITSRVFALCNLAVNHLGSSLFCTVAQKAVTAKSAEIRSLLARIFLIISGISTVLFGSAVTMNESFVRLWVGDHAFTGLAVSATLCLAYLFSSRLSIAVTLLTALGSIRQTAWCSVLDVALRLIAILILLPRLGLVAVPLAVLIASSVTSVFLARLIGRAAGLRLRDGIQLLGTGGPVTLFVAGAGIVGATVGTVGGWVSFATIAILTTAALAVAVFPFIRTALHRQSIPTAVDA